jgi:peptide/nickel transport system ATP-binding protein
VTFIMERDREQPRGKGDRLLDIEGLLIDGRSGNDWHSIVRGVDLTVRRGEVLGLIGESGAGKSTIGLAAMGYVRSGCRFSGGRVVFAGRDLLTLDRRQRTGLRGARIAYVAQSAAAAFNPAHRLLPQVIEARLRQGGGPREAEADALALFAKLHLPDPDRIGLRYPHEVSGGQLQRAMTAMAMICRPDLIVFDEPTTALDVTTQVEVLAAIRDIVDEFHTAALYITHDLAVVAQLAHRILVLRHGEAVEEAPTRTMLSAPREAYTRSLWAVRNLNKTPRTSDEIVFSMQHIHAGYWSAKVLEDVSITVERGCTVAVVGESGSGKSTLARVATGLLPPSQGEMRFCGQPLPASLRHRDADQHRRIQMIYQNPDSALNPRHTVRDVIGRPLTFFFGLRGAEREKRIRELLDMVQLGPQFLERLPRSLSGGQKQRLCIARALAAEPTLVICDEVTSALDQIVQEEILKLLLRLQAELGVSYLFITHDLATVRAIADTVVVMRRGRVEQQGPRDTVLSPPHPDYTERLLSSVPTMDPDWLTNLLAARGN